jgi:hypothetical protein
VSTIDILLVYQSKSSVFSKLREFFCEVFRARVVIDHQLAQIPMPDGLGKRKNIQNLRQPRNRQVARVVN